MTERTNADFAASHLRAKNAGCDAYGDDDCWALSAASPDDLYEVYDEWAAARGRRRAKCGRSWHERATAPCRSVMRALSHTKRGRELFDVGAVLSLPGFPILATLRPEARRAASPD